MANIQSDAADNGGYIYDFDPDKTLGKIDGAFIPGQEKTTHRDVEAFYNEVLENLKDWDLRQEGRVVAITGMGGEGKTQFLQDLSHLAERKGFRPLVWMDLRESTGGLISQLLAVSRGLSRAGYIPMRFLLGYFLWNSGGGRDDAVKQLKEEVERIRGKTATDKMKDWLEKHGEIVSLGGPVLGTSAAGPVAALCILFASLSALLNWSDSSKKDVMEESAQKCYDSLRDMTPGKIETVLPGLLREDIEDIASARRETLVIEADAIEHLWRSSRSVVIRAKCEWFESITSVPNTLWIVSSRDRLSWDNVMCYPIELGDLDLNGVQQYLEQHGIGTEYVNRAYQITNGTPVFLNLLCSTLKQKGIRVIFDDEFTTQVGLSDAINRERLLKHYVSDLEDEDECAVYLLAYLREWDEDFAVRVLSAALNVDEYSARARYFRIRNLSFMQDRLGMIQMHETVAEMLRNMDAPFAMAQAAFDRFCGRSDDLRKQLRSDENLGKRVIEDRTFALARAVCDMVDTGHATMREPALRNTRIAFARAIPSRGGTLEDAMKLLEHYMDVYGGGDIPSEDRLYIELAHDALSTQMWLRTGDRRFHCAEGIILAKVEKHKNRYSADLLRRARNAAGVSLMRVAKTPEEFRQSLRYHYPNWKEVSQKSDEDCSAWDLVYMANYGATILSFATECPDEPDMGDLLVCGVNAFDRSIGLRMKRSVGTSPIVLRNRVSRAAINRLLWKLDEAESELGELRKEYEAAQIPWGDADRLRAEYQWGLLLESKAQYSENAEMHKEAQRYLNDALQIHERVFQLRVKNLGQTAEDTDKSRKAIQRLRKLLEA